jgi:hypothetical protein
MLFYCSVVLLPLITQNLMGYPATQAGLLNSRARSWSSSSCR